VTCALFSCLASNALTLLLSALPLSPRLVTPAVKRATFQVHALRDRHKALSADSVVVRLVASATGAGNPGTSSVILSQLSTSCNPD
jgi:hypothetical protein